MNKIQCGLCPAQMTSAVGYVAVAEYHHPYTVKVDKPICLRCHGLIVAAQGEQIFLVKNNICADGMGSVGGR